MTSNVFKIEKMMNREDEVKKNEKRFEDIKFQFKASSHP